MKSVLRTNKHTGIQARLAVCHDRSIKCGPCGCSIKCALRVSAAFSVQ